MEDRPGLVENLVDGMGGGAYCPTSAPLLRTVIWVTALARGWGNPAVDWTRAGRPRDAGCEKSLRRERRDREERESGDHPTS